MLRRPTTTVLVMAGFLATASGSSALTLGNTTLPSGASANDCPGGILIWQSGTDPSYTYAVPAGGGAITSWSVNTTGDAPGATLAHPITVASGDTLGLWSASLVGCYFGGGALTSSDSVLGGTAATAPSAGNQYASLGGPPDTLMDVSATLAQNEDVGVTGVAAPASVTTGSGAAYGFTVTNAGPASGNITFTDAIPSGLKIIAAAADSGACTTSGQTVTCTIAGLPAGGTAPVWIVVSAASAGSYADTAAVTTALSDPTPADNSATATLTVTAPPLAPPPSCTTLDLAGAPLALAKAAIRALNCSIGKTTKKSSKKIREGLVISTSPGSGKTLANGTKVNFVVSSGPPKKKKKKK